MLINSYIGKVKVRRIKTLARIKSFLIIAVVAANLISASGNVFAITIDGLKYASGSITRYQAGNVTSAFDVRGKINGGNTYNFQTTYNNGGYTIDFEVDETNYPIHIINNGATITNNGVKLTLVSDTTSDGIDVNLAIVNPEGNGDHTYRVAMTADIQLGSNDYAAIYKKDYSGLVITQDDPSKAKDYGAKIFINFTPNVNTSWLGNYKDRFINKFVDGTVRSYTVVDKMDTAAAWSWDGALAAGEEITLTTNYSLTEAETAAVSFYNQDGELVSKEEALIGGAVTFPVLSDPEPGQLHVWCEDESNYDSCHAGGTAIIVEEDELSFRETYIADPNYVPTPDTPDDPNNSDEPLNPETPSNPDGPQNPENPETPSNPDGPQNPENPETPQPSEPEEPSEPVVPQPTDPEPSDPQSQEPDNPQQPQTDEPEQPQITAEPESQTQTSGLDETSSQDDHYVSGTMDQADTTSDYIAQSDIVRPISSNIENHVIDGEAPKKTEPLGVAKSTGSNNLWEAIGGILPLLALVLFTFFFFLILLFKRRKDEDEEEESK